MRRATPHPPAPWLSRAARLFVIAGAPVAGSAAVVEAGLDFRLTNAATLGPCSYAGQYGSGLKDHSARVNLNLSF